MDAQNKVQVWLNSCAPAPDSLIVDEADRVEEKNIQEARVHAIIQESPVQVERGQIGRWIRLLALINSDKVYDMDTARTLAAQLEKEMRIAHQRTGVVRNRGHYRGSNNFKYYYLNS